jgi:hypothetical protein
VGYAIAAVVRYHRPPCRAVPFRAVMANRVRHGSQWAGLQCIASRLRVRARLVVAPFSYVFILLFLSFFTFKKDIQEQHFNY